ncbi:speckle-type POZ protein-like [Uloborus diversus]|uniref:speckle-type POZ protein-like n=1 Tax=Uloborus diversus TaxID=327109 RepID=UPI0024096B3E|nr:speckle-type POZ protein-like [Uloborus diversus]
MEVISSYCLSNEIFSFHLSDSSACVIWKVKDFSTLKKEPNIYASPEFILKKVKWHLSLYPFGNKVENLGYVSLYLTPHSSFPLEVKFQVFIRNETDADKVCEEVRHNFAVVQGWGFPQLFDRQDLLDGDLGDFLPNDVLTIYCKIKIIENVEAETLRVTEDIAKSKRDSFFLRKFRQPLDSGKLSDVVLRVGEEKIPAHKVILSTHSGVFRAMFESNFKENQDNVVDLIDMDLTVAKAMLLYIYTREVEELSTEKTLELYVAADRYMLTELKEECREYVSKNVTSQNVGDTFEIAKLHSDVVLSEAAKNFFAQNVKSILKSKEWKEYSAQKPSSSVELLTYAITSND